jgi:periplasmic divalent cation tolerance protein
MPDPILVFCSCPNQTTALSLANFLVEAGIAACVTVQGGDAVSVYRWQGQIEQAAEVVLLIKTTADRYSDLEQAILARHPYELPEIIAVPIIMGLSGYLSWVEQCTKASS